MPLVKMNGLNPTVISVVRSAACTPHAQSVSWLYLRIYAAKLGGARNCPCLCACYVQPPASPCMAVVTQLHHCFFIINVVINFILEIDPFDFIPVFRFFWSCPHIQGRKITMSRHNYQRNLTRLVTVYGDFQVENLIISRQYVVLLYQYE